MGANIKASDHRVVAYLMASLFAENDCISNKGTAPQQRAKFKRFAI